MIIGIDASRANRKQKTGTEWYSYYLIKYLAQIDSENQYILYSDKPLEDGLSNLSNLNEGGIFSKPKFDKNGYQIINSPHNNFKAKVLRWPFTCLWTLGRFSLEMLFRSPDILFVPAHTVPLFHPKKTITTIHDVAFMRKEKIYQKNIGPNSNKTWTRGVIRFLVRLITRRKYELNNLDYLKWSTKYSLQTAKKIITVSNFTKKEIIDIYGTEEKKLSVVYNGYNNKLYRKIDDKKRIKEILDKYGVFGEYFLYVGRLEKKKNTPRLVESFAILKENNPEIKHKLVLIGCAGYCYDEVKYLIKEYNVEDDVILLGWVPEIDLPYFFNGAEAFVFPTLYEGFGIPVIQALACGVPVVASGIEVLKEVSDGKALFFNPYNKEEISRALYKIIIDKDLREKLSKEGLERAKDFSWDKCAKETYNQIKSL
ncbi:glycosyltransferase family 1 protein [bacterium]|nr:glycosyltransferase family 1 protein [bacterium]